MGFQTALPIRPEFFLLVDLRGKKSGLGLGGRKKKKKL